MSDSKQEVATVPQRLWVPFLVFILSALSVASVVFLHHSDSAGDVSTEFEDDHVHEQGHLVSYDYHRKKLRKEWCNLGHL